MRANLIAAACGFLVAIGLGAAASAGASTPCAPATFLDLEYASYTVDGTEREPIAEHPPIDRIWTARGGAFTERTEPLGVRSVVVVPQ